MYLLLDTYQYTLNNYQKRLHVFNFLYTKISVCMTNSNHLLMLLINLLNTVPFFLKCFYKFCMYLAKPFIMDRM